LNAAIGLRDDEALALQQAQSLAQGCAAHLELAGQGRLRRDMSRRYLASQDRVTQPVVDDRHMRSA
jgi:hypothetical protein